MAAKTEKPSDPRLMRTAGDPAMLSSADGEGGLLQVLMPMRVA